MRRSATSPSATACGRKVLPGSRPTPSRTRNSPPVTEGACMRSLAEIDAELTAPGQPFEIEEIPIRRVPTRTWKHAPASLREVFLRSKQHAGSSSPFIVLGDERLGYEEHFRRVMVFARRLVEELGFLHGDRVVI